MIEKKSHGHHTVNPYGAIFKLSDMEQQNKEIDSGDIPSELYTGRVLTFDARLRGLPHRAQRVVLQQIIGTSIVVLMESSSVIGKVDAHDTVVNAFSHPFQCQQDRSLAARVHAVCSVVRDPSYSAGADGESSHPFA